MVELIRELRIVLQVHAAREHHVDGEIEVHARGVKPITVVVRHSGAVAGLRTADQVLNLLRMLVIDNGLLRLYGRWRFWDRLPLNGARLLRGSRSGGGGVGGHTSRSCGRIRRILWAARKENKQRGEGRH